MNKLLDLVITLESPPTDAPPGTIAAINLRCDALGLKSPSDILGDPFERGERDDLHWYLEEYWKWPFEGFRQRAEAIEQRLPVLGRRLYDQVFKSREAVQLVSAWQLQPGVQRQISIVSALPQALSLPWELLHDEQGFLALRLEPVMILRRIEQTGLATLTTDFTPPLRVLLVTARPEGAGFVDPRSIARELLDEVEPQIEQGAMALEFLRPPTFSALRERLRDRERPVHVLHFDGHGIFIGQPSADGLSMWGGSQGQLAFEDDAGALDLKSAGDLAQVLQQGSVRLVMLTACQSAMGGSDDVFSSVSARLIKGGIDAVAAMSTSVLVTSATRYAEAFYRALAGGKPAPLAQEYARQALHDDPKRHVFRRRRDDDSVPVELRDWWMPHFYQQRPLTLEPKAPRKRKRYPTIEERLGEAMPDAPRYRFSGRAHELLQIERVLLRHQLIVVHGFGGVGKTALSRETADWLTRTGMYARALFVSFEAGGGATVLLSALVQRLNIGGAYNPEDVSGTLKLLRPALKKLHMLLIVDNLESILPGGEAPLDDTERARLWDVLLELTQMHAGVLLTTRSTNFGDGRMAEGARVLYLPLGGLHPDDAYALATNLLKDLRIDPKCAPYRHLRDLLVQFDHHPLAIQLVLPALREHPIERIRDDFAALLHEFIDDTARGRNRSLLASLDYSLRRLTDTHRTLLPRLALFEGGASEDDLLAITKIPEAEWAALRSALGQAALLTAERVHERITEPFLHFHPVLAPYLRTLPGADNAEGYQSYAGRYHALATHLYHEDKRNPEPVRSLARRELRNLRRALDLLLELGEHDVAVALTTCITHFLTIFGLLREREDLERKIAALPKPTDAVLTETDYLRESNAGEHELARGNVRAASTRFMALHARMEALPEGAPLGHRSYEHCLTLGRLARCLAEGGQPAVAEERLREALQVIDALIAQHPENHGLIRERGVLLTDWADILTKQGKYSTARTACEAGLAVAKQVNDQRQQGVVMQQLGRLALEHRDYAEAHERYMEALALFRTLQETAMEAMTWHQLGRVAGQQRQWSEAEHCYRQSLALAEQIGDGAVAAKTCHNLAIVAQRAGRPIEAEGWYKRAIDLTTHSADQVGLARHLNNLANLLTEQVRAGHAPRERLHEAAGYAKRALASRETHDVSSGIWQTLTILAEIAEMDGQADDAGMYRRRAHETFAAFAGNRYHIDKDFGELITAIVAAAQGNEQARVVVEQLFTHMEVNDWCKVPSVIRRIWAAERDWYGLCDGLDLHHSLLVLRVLEELERPSFPRYPSPAGGVGESVVTPEQVIAAIPMSVREAMQREDQAAFEQAMAELPTEEQQQVVAALQWLQAQQEAEEDTAEPDMAAVLEQFEPLLQAIAAVAAGDESQREEIESVLASLETKGWRLTNSVQRMWAGERDAAALTAGLEEQDAAIVRRLLQLMAP